MIKVKWLKAHPRFAYFAGQIGFITPEWAVKLLAGGYVILVPDAEEVKIQVPKEKINPLPEDLPGRDKLFLAGFESADKVKEVMAVNEGDGLLDAGISVSMLKKVRKYFK